MALFAGAALPDGAAEIGVIPAVLEAGLDEGGEGFLFAAARAGVGAEEVFVAAVFVLFADGLHAPQVAENDFDEVCEESHGVSFERIDNDFSALFRNFYLFVVYPFS